MNRRPFRSALAVALAALLAAPPGGAAGLDAEPAFADPGGRGAPRASLAVVAVAGDGADRAALLVATIAESVARRMEDRFEVDEPWDAEAERAREAAVAKARQYLRAADDLYAELDLQTSADTAATASKGLEKANLGLYFSELARARTLQIRALFGNGADKAARAEVDRLLPVSPNAAFDPKMFPPDILAAIHQRRDEIRAKSDLMLEITAQVPARVYLDGIFRGISPASIKRLAPGDHYVTVAAPGFKLHQELVKAGSSITLELAPTDRLPELKKLLADVRAALDDEPRRDAALRAFGRSVGAAQVLVVFARRSGSALQASALRLAAEDGHHLAWVEESLPEGDDGKLTAAAGAFVERALAADVPRVDGKPVTSSSSKGLFAGLFSGVDLKLDRKTGGYVVAGTGAALVVAGILFGAMALGKQGQFRSMPQTHTDAKDVENSGRTLAAVADLSLLLGLAGAGVGSYLSFGPGAPGVGEAGESVAERPRRTVRPAPTPARPAVTMPPPPAGTHPVRPAAPARARPAAPPAAAEPEEPPPRPKPPPSPPRKPRPAAEPDGDTFDDLRDDQ